ncbi:substrate-binding domain-containing protein [Candidatus Caldatribacterium saccharofermentans]|uniref:substrate-binding domain-containing protein n=1 Tax=Candidatus Caldatribacterium saccharofermentans TaxID=1454753 RepID=UPI003D03EADF
MAGKGVKVLVLILLLLSTISGIAEAKQLKIGFAHVALNCPYYLAMKATAEEKAKEYGVELLLLNAENEIEKQIKDIETLLLQGVDALIVNPVTEYGLRPVMQKVKEKGIPVVVIDRPMYGDYLVYVGIDQWQAGRLQGEFIGQLLGGKGNIIEIAGDPGCPAGKGRGGGLREVLSEKYPDIKILATYMAHYNKAEGMKAMEDAIAAYGDKINLVYAHNDAMALGALDALRAAGMTNIPVCGVDGQKEAYLEIMKGEQYKSTVINNPSEITAKAFDILMEYLQTGKLPEGVTKGGKVITGTILVTKENVEHYYDPDSIF